jgi:pilus assembly protein CpaF
MGNLAAQHTGDDWEGVGRPSTLESAAADGAGGSLVDHLHRVLLDGSGADPRAVSAQALAIVDREAALLHDGTRAALAGSLIRRATGLGPLEALLDDPAIDEVMVTGCAPIWVERDGRIQQTAERFPTEAMLREIIDRILAPLGRRVDATQPLCDARLLDGSRVNVAIPPLAIDGTALTIRRFRPGGRSIDELVDSGSWAPEAAALLRDAVGSHRTILVCGATGSGKTTVLGALSEAIPAGERIITIEDAAELALRQPHVVRLEARPPNMEGDGEVTIRALIKNAMRMRPDRLVIGEVRGGEALDLLIALSSGHAGGLSTIHAGSPAEAMRRLELLAMLADADLPLPAITALVRGSVELIVHQRRGTDGSRYLAEIAEVDPSGGLPRPLWVDPRERRR